MLAGGLFGLSGEIRLSMVKDLLGLGSGSEVGTGTVVTGSTGRAGGSACWGGGGGGGGGANKNLFIFANAASSFSNLSLSDFMSLKRFLLRKREPFSNMSRAAGCSAQ